MVGGVCTLGGVVKTKGYSFVSPNPRQFLYHNERGCGFKKGAWAIHWVWLLCCPSKRERTLNRGGVCT